MQLITLSSLDLVGGGILVLGVSSLSAITGLRLGKSMILSAVRMSVQLFLVGLILKALFAYIQLGWMTLVAMLMILLAGREIMARQERKFSGGWSYLLGTSAIGIPTFLTTMIALCLLIRPEPWYQPQYAIPLLGMLLGNSMTGAAIGMDRLTQATWQQKSIIEGRMMLGESVSIAIRDIRRESIRAGLIPIINSMAAAGIVSLPGMMTGQILAGSSPSDAVSYQILIFLLIAANTGFSTFLGVWLGSKRLYDERDRLRLDRLQHVVR